MILERYHVAKLNGGFSNKYHKFKFEECFSFNLNNMTKESQYFKSMNNTTKNPYKIMDTFKYAFKIIFPFY